MIERAMLVLHQFPISPFCDKIRRVLHVKRVPYRVRDVATGNIVVVKLLNAGRDWPGLADRFEREQTALAQLVGHPNIVAVYGHGWTETGMPYVVLMPIFADRILRSGGRELASLLGSTDLGAMRLGILMGATGVGAMLGALTLAMRSGVKGLGRWITICCAGFGLSLTLFAFSKSFWLSVILLLPVGYFVMLQMACSNTLIQVMVPDALRGRAMAVYSMMFMGMAPIGALLG